MKNVKPMVGQVWGGTFRREICIGRIKNNIVSYGSGQCHIDGFHKHFTFIPQTDVEWLAVNEPEWNTKYQFIWRKGDYCYATDDPKGVVAECYNRQQWQNMRYELGLDDKPKRKIWLGNTPYPPMNINCPCVLIPLKKETKMIDLSDVSIYDKYNSNNEVYKVVLVGPNDLVVNGNGDHHYVIDRSTGVSFCKEVQLISKHETRHWLKDLPDANLFEDYIYLYYSSNGLWCYSKHSKTLDEEENNWTGSFICLSGIKMPTLTGDEWKDSKISIAELREWQERDHAD